MKIGRKGTMTDETIESKYLNEEITLTIYKPEAFSTLYKYNLCIMQDGNDYYQLGKIATLSDALHTNHDIDLTIFIGIHYKDKFDRRDKYHPNGSKSKAYMKFLVHEVVPFLDELLPTLHMGQTRALIGDSLAGTQALMTALTYPHTFGKVIMQSPLVNNTVMQTVNDSNDIALIDIYHTIGLKETAVETTADGVLNFINPNKELYELLTLKGANYQYEEFSTGEHTWKYWQRDLPNALKTIFN